MFEAYVKSVLIDKTAEGVLNQLLVSRWCCSAVCHTARFLYSLNLDNAMPGLYVGTAPQYFGWVVI